MSDRDPAFRQSIAADQFFYFFLRLRKSRIRKVVEALNADYPGDTAEQKARRLIESQTALSFIGGALMHLPALIPGLGRAIHLMGVVGGASAITRMHLYLILEIALLFGKDIDDEERVPEMLAVVAATSLTAGAPLLADLLEITPLISIPAAGVTASAVTQLIGQQAIRYYSAAKELPPGRRVEEIEATG